MGQNNSSEIRVAPLGRLLLEHHEYVDELLHLVGCSRVKFGEFSDKDVWFADQEMEKKRSEKSLTPSKEHLKAIIRLIDSDDAAMAYFKKAVEGAKGKIKEEKWEKRHQLSEKKLKKEDAFQAIEFDEDWAFLEGTSKPDLFIESEKFILIVEGKLTEPKTTTSTTYLQSRNQILRHIQGAIEYKRKNNLKKRIIAFYIVPETFSEIREIKDQNHFDEVIAAESVKITDADYIQEIKDCYYGCTTWEAVAKKFGIAFRAVIDKK